MPRARSLRVRGRRVGRTGLLLILEVRLNTSRHEAVVGTPKIGASPRITDRCRVIRMADRDDHRLWSHAGRARRPAHAVHGADEPRVLGGCTARCRIRLKHRLQIGMKCCRKMRAGHAIEGTQAYARSLIMLSISDELSCRTPEKCKGQGQILARRSQQARRCARVHLLHSKWVFTLAGDVSQ